MPKVKLLMPADSTFLSSIIYEGLLYLIHKDYAKRFSFREIDFKPNFLSKAYSELEDEKIQNIRIAMAGNDNLNSKLFEKLGSNLKSRKTFYDLIKMLKDNAGIIKEKDIDMQFRISGRDNLLDVNRRADGIAAPQLFKVDRYTGFSSLETPYTSRQLTFYISSEVALISLLGIYSSFVISIRQQEQNYYFFVFFSPDEVLKLLIEESKDLVDKYYTLKNVAMERLREIIGKYPLNELMVIELTLNLEIRSMMDSENIDKISLLLFKIAPEGQTYKIYETLPLEIYRRIAFYEIAKKYSKNAEDFIKKVSEALSPDSILMKALSTLNRRNRFTEAEDVFSAIQSLYRFVILGDAQGFFTFLQKLDDARKKLENSKNSGEAYRAKRYRQILAMF